MLARIANMVMCEPASTALQTTHNCFTMHSKQTNVPYLPYEDCYLAASANLPFLTFIVLVSNLITCDNAIVHHLDNISAEKQTHKCTGQLWTWDNGMKTVQARYAGNVSCKDIRKVLLPAPGRGGIQHLLQSKMYGVLRWDRLIM